VVKKFKIFLRKLKIFKIILLILNISLLINTKVYANEYVFKKITELKSPWGMSFINENELIISEQSGNLMIVNITDGKKSQIKHNLNFIKIGQGGLLDVIHKDNFIWIAYTEIREQWEINGFFGTITSTSIAKGKFDKSKINFKNIFQAEPPLETPQHFGSRLEIKEDFLFASIGERGEGMIAQDGTKHPGSIIRIHTDGSIPKDNPKFQDKPSWLPEIFQIGVRNPQGLTLSPFDGKIYLSNHGARGGDWFGEIKKGENYGWKILGWGGTNYSGTKIGPKWKAGFTKAIQYWVPSIAVSAITIYKGNEFKDWNGHALVTSLKDQSLRKLVFDDLSNIKEEIIFKDKIGRIRDIQIHPNNGKIYFLGGENLWLMERK
jgi:glucose/arabinose dehydrogenase